MKITRIDGYPLDFPQDPPWGYAKGWVSSAPALIIEVYTDEGLSGLGEAYGPPRAVHAMVRSLCEPLAVGADPFGTESLWARMVHEARDFTTSGAALAAISAIDIACWDIKGKALGVPVCTLLGGPVRRALPCYASAIRYLRDPSTSDELADPARTASSFANQGFGAMKMAIGLLEPTRDLERVKRVRESLGPDVDLIVDANQAYQVRQAADVGRALEDLGVLWFEEPLAPDDLPGLTALRKRLRVPLAGGEALATRAGFRRVISRHLLDIIVLETGLAGGLTECRKILDMAQAFGIESTMHGYASVVGTAAALHLAAAMPPPASPAPWTMLPFEYAPEPFSRSGDLALEPLVCREGVIEVPLDRPGLGVELDRDALERRLMR